MSVTAVHNPPPFIDDAPITIENDPEHPLEPKQRRILAQKAQLMQLEMQALRRSGSSALDLRERAAQMQRDLKSLASQEFGRPHLSAHLTKTAERIQQRVTLIDYLKIPLGVGDAVLDYGKAVVSALGFVADGGRIVGGCMRVLPPDPEAAKRMEQRSQSVGSFFRTVGDLAVLAESSPGALYDAALQRTEERGKRMANSSRAIVQAIGDLPAPEQGRLATRIATHGLLLRYPFPLELGPLTATEPSLVLARAATGARPPATAARTSTLFFERVSESATTKPALPIEPVQLGEALFVPYRAPQGEVHRYTVLLNGPGREGIFDIAVMKPGEGPVLEVFAENLVGLRSPSQQTTASALEALQQLGRFCDKETVRTRLSADTPALSHLLARKTHVTKPSGIPPAFQEIADYSALGGLIAAKVWRGRVIAASRQPHAAAFHPDLVLSRLGRLLEEKTPYPLSPEGNALYQNAQMKVLATRGQSALCTFEIPTHPLLVKFERPPPRDVHKTGTTTSIDTAPGERTLTMMRPGHESVARVRAFEKEGELAVHVVASEGFVTARRTGGIDVEGFIEHIQAGTRQRPAMIVVAKPLPGTAVVEAEARRLGYVTEEVADGEFIRFTVPGRDN